MVVDYLPNLLRPSSAVVGFESEDIGGVEVEGDLLERVVGFSWHL